MCVQIQQGGRIPFELFIAGVRGNAVCDGFYNSKASRQNVVATDSGKTSYGIARFTTCGFQETSRMPFPPSKRGCRGRKSRSGPAASCFPCLAV